MPRIIRHLLSPLIGFGILFLVLQTSLVATASQPSGPDYDVPGGHFFTQASSIPGEGFAVTNTDGVPFWKAYLADGGPKVLGYPISQRFFTGGTLCQAMQRVVLQWMPDGHGGGKVQFLNIMDILHRAGKDQLLLQRYGIPSQSDWRTDSVFHGQQGPVYQAHLALVNAVRATHPGLVYAYYLGGITRYGLPMAPMATTDAGWLLRTQRAVLLEAHSTGTPPQIRLMDVGIYARDLGLFSPAVFVPQPPPSAPIAQLQPTSRQLNLVAGDSTVVEGWILQGNQPMASVPPTLQLQAQVAGPDGLPVPPARLQTTVQGDHFWVRFTPASSGIYTVRTWLSGSFSGIPISRQDSVAQFSLTITPNSPWIVYGRLAPWSYGATAAALMLFAFLLRLWLTANFRRAQAVIRGWHGTQEVVLGQSHQRIGAAHFHQAIRLSLWSGRPRLRLRHIFPGAPGCVRLSAEGLEYRRGIFGRWTAMSPGHHVGPPQPSGTASTGTVKPSRQPQRPGVEGGGSPQVPTRTPFVDDSWG